MSELISGKEALIALANGKDVEFKDGMEKWENIKHHMNLDLSMFLTAPEWMTFRLKPRTIALNGIEVPINRKKNDKDQVVWIINTSCESWYDWVYGSDCDSDTLYWDSEEEIKQVVAALRDVFK